MKTFRFTTDPVIHEGTDINEAFSKYCATMWFPGLIFAQELQNGNDVGKTVNLRIPTNEGVEFERIRALNRNGYHEACAMELVRLCQQLGIKRFRFRENKNGEISMLCELNHRGLEFSKKHNEDQDEKMRVK